MNNPPLRWNHKYRRGAVVGGASGRYSPALPERETRTKTSSEVYVAASKSEYKTVTAAGKKQKSTNPLDILVLDDTKGVINHIKKLQLCQYQQVL